MKPISNPKELDEALQQHQNIIIYKHSTQCPISAQAKTQVEEFLKQEDAPIAYIRVIEEREVSNHAQELTGVNHESPQAILLADKEVAWSASHRDITTQNLTKAWNSVNNS